MSIEAKMYVDDRVYTIKNLEFGFSKKLNTNGTAATKPEGGVFKIEIESPKETNLYAWGASNYDMKYVKIVFSPIRMDTNSRTMELYDTLCIQHYDNFYDTSTKPMITHIHLSPAILVQNGETLFERDWKLTDIHRPKTEPTRLPFLSPREDEEPKLVDYFITDLDENVTNEYDPGDIILLHIKTQNRIDDKLTINLNNKTRDFKHNGVVLANDTLNHVISSDLDKIELEVIDQQN